MLAERWCFLWSHSPLVTEGKGEGEASLTSVSSVTSSVRSKPQAKVSSLEKLASQCPDSLSQGTGKCWVSQVVHHGGGHQCLPAPGKAVVEGERAHGNPNHPTASRPRAPVAQPGTDHAVPPPVSERLVSLV